VFLLAALVADAIVTAVGIYQFGTVIEANRLLYPLWEWSLANVEMVQQPFGMDQMANPLREEWFVAAVMFAVGKAILSSTIPIGLYLARKLGAPYAREWGTLLLISVVAAIVHNGGVWL